MFNFKASLFKFNRAQIGIFVIISIIIVALGVFLFSYNSDSIHLFNNDKSSYKVKEFVTSCMNIEVDKAVNKIGLHGGWLYSPLFENSNSLFANKDTNKYLIKSMLGYQDIGGVKMPYWFYYDDSEKKFKTNIPDFASNSKYSLKNQVKRYLDENLNKDCLKNFETFKDVYEINFDPKKMNSKVDFDEENLKVSLNMPLDIHEINSNNTEFIEDFNIKKRNKLWVPYNIAKDILRAEMNTSFIEKRIMSFIRPYQSSNDRNLLPPFYDYQLKYDFRPWDIKKSEKLFREILSSNINYLQFLNSNYNEHKLPDSLKDSEFAKAINRLYTKDYLSQYSEVLKNRSLGKSLFNEYKDYSIKTRYEYFFPTFFSISPSMGDVILLPRPEAVINLIPIFFTEYVAVYEITTPIVFEIKDSVNKNDNFVFNLAIEANIDHNVPLAENKVFNFSLDKIELSKDKTLICNPIQRVSDYVYLNITDPLVNGKRKYEKVKNSLKYKVNLEPNGVEDALVTFNCKGLATCPIGMTKINTETKFGGHLTQLKFRLPVNCNPGKLEIYKFGYQKLVFDNLNPSVDKPINLGTQIMGSAKKLNLRIKLLGRNDNIYSLGRSLKDYETGFIIFKNKETEDFVKVVEINRTNQFNLSIDLIPGNYSVKGFVIYNHKVHIPSEKICYRKGLFSGKKCQTIPEVNMDSWIKGGLDLDEFEVPYTKLLYNNKIVVPLVDYGIPNSFSELEALSSTMGNLKGISESKIPYFEYK